MSGQSWPGTSQEADRMRFIGVVFSLIILMSQQDALANTGLILQTASQNAQPKYFAPPHDTRGLCGDIYTYLGLRMARYGIKLVDDRQPLPIKQILDDVLSGKRHIYCGAGRNSDRETLYHFSENPLYTLANILITHKDNRDAPKSLKEFAASGIRIGTYANTSSARWLQKQPGLHVDESYEDLAIALQQISNRQLSYFFYHDLGLDHLMRVTPDHQAKKVARQYRTKFHWMMMSKTLPEPVVTLLNREITAMIDAGEVERIRQNYRP